MSLLDFLGLGWKPREGMVYKNKVWGRRRHVTGEAQGHILTGEFWSNNSKVYARINGVFYPGSFRVTTNSCTLGILGDWGRIRNLYKTSTENVKFSKKYLGRKTHYDMYGSTSHIRNYEYIAEVLDSTKLSKEKIPDQIVRRRGTAIVDAPKGILVASGRHRLFLLPGGGANKGESREKAAIRELHEETGLHAQKCKFLFEYNDPDDGRKIRNLHKIFLIEAKGTPKLNHHDVHHVAYWTQKSDLRLSKSTKNIIDQYLAEFKK